MTAWIYSRVSTQRQVPGLSLDAQEERARARAAADGHQDAQVVRDAGVSGRSMDRPGISHLLDQIRPGDTLYVWSISRLGRNVREVLRVVEDLIIPQQIILVSVTEPIDTSNPVGRCMLSILASLAQLEREQISGDMRRGMEERVARGLHWSTPPYGYRCEDKRLVPDPQFTAVVRELYVRAANGATRRELARWLNDQGVPTRSGRPWHYASVARILSNPAYMGRIPFRGDVLPGTHEPLVPDDLWDQVQRIVAVRSRIPPPARVSSWASLYRCGVCGSSVCISSAGAHPRRTYQCVARLHVVAARRHESIGTPAAKADHWLWESFCRTIAGESLREWERLTGEDGRDAARDAERHELAAERDKLLLSLDRNHRGWVSGLVPEGLYAQVNRELMEALGAAERRLGELATLDDAMSISQTLTGGREMLELLDSRQRRDVLLRLVDHVGLRHNDLTVHWALPTLPRMRIELPRYWSPARNYGTARITYLPATLRD
ncbi:MAG: recombinase family protein [Veillonellaceae bacterium]|nr:recombinase family protein [Veillonellaceae bacterium]